MSSLISAPCSWCGKNKKVFPSLLKGKKYGTFCNKHCLGKFRSRKLTGDLASNYKTGSRKSRQYIEVEAAWHPNKNKRGYVFLHRLIVESKIGRFLDSNEVIHHIDDNPKNNHWSNLEIIDQAKHAKIHSLKRKRLKNGRFE